MAKIGTENKTRCPQNQSLSEQESHVNNEGSRAGEGLLLLEAQEIGGGSERGNSHQGLRVGKKEGARWEMGVDLMGLFLPKDVVSTALVSGLFVS